MGTGGGVAGLSFTGRPGTSIRMLNLRLYRSTSSAGGTTRVKKTQYKLCVHHSASADTVPFQS